MLLLCLAAAGALSSGCYYTHLAAGQLRILAARESIEDVRANPASSDALREQLALVERARSFAEEIGLEAGGRYTSYVDWPGDRIITTLVATNPGEVEAANFHFPIVGSVPYKGFFDQAEAEAEATELRASGQDVCVVPVTAYSTLGWIDDPITGPMLRGARERLVETVLHELVHATVFVPSQPEFNEGAARFIGQEAAVRFYADREPGRGERQRVSDDRQVAAALLAFRERVATLYAEGLASDVGASRRVALETSFRSELRRLPLSTRDTVDLALRARLNDACLAISGTYAADDARHISLLAELGGDLTRFIERLRAAAEAADPRAEFLGVTGASATGDPES